MENPGRNPRWLFVAREGLPFLLPPLVIGMMALAVGWELIGWSALFAAAFVGFFFRDPERAIPKASGSVVSPADGRVVAVMREEPSSEGRGPDHKISIFLSLFNVHVNRSPCDSTVEEVNYKSGSFLPAYKGEASEANERNLVVLGIDGARIEVTQIAGILARRIVCWVKPGDRLVRGQRMGLIRFGSRVDVTLPASATLLVREGAKVKGGSTILARLT